MNQIPNEELFKEIDLIQACIDRMARNSFMIKGWALTLFAGALALLKGDIFSYPWLVLIAVVLPYIAFWYIDAYFLNVEKSYRALYKWVITQRPNGDKTRQYDLDPRRFMGKFHKVFFSKTLLLFFGVPSIIITIISVVSLIKSSIGCAS